MIKAGKRVFVVKYADQSGEKGNFTNQSNVP